MFFNPQEFRFMKHQQQPHIKSHKRTPSGTVHVTADTGVKIKMSPPKMSAIGFGLKGAV